MPSAMRSRICFLALGEHRPFVVDLTAVDLGEDAGLQRGVEDALPARDRRDRIADDRAVGLLRPVPGGAGGDRAVDQRALHRGRQHQHPGRELIPAHRLGDVDPLEAGHVQVEDRDVRLQAPDLLQRVSPVAALGDQFEVGS